jgi:hypothetical protein
LENLSIGEAGLEVKKKTERRILDVIWQGPVKVCDDPFGGFSGLGPPPVCVLHCRSLIADAPRDDTGGEARGFGMTAFLSDSNYE